MFDTRYWRQMTVANDTFYNPYNFVKPIYKKREDEPGGVMDRCPPPPHDRYVGYSGQIECVLTAMTPLFVSDSEGVEIEHVRRKGKVEDHRKYRFFRLPGTSGDVHAIPSTSLRGMIRSVFETVTNSCFSILQDKSDLKRMQDKSIRDVLDKDREYCLLPCDRYDRLCPACRVFGWVRKEGERKSWQDRVSYAGRVEISHAVMTSGNTMEERTLAILASPKPSATFFYLLDTSDKPRPQLSYDPRTARLRGRKHYLTHQEVDTDIAFSSPKSGQNRTAIDAVAEGATFSFTIRFWNLAAAELGALLWSIRLEDNMVHRLGYAKPLGFGAVRIDIDTSSAETFLVDFDRRYCSIATGRDVGWRCPMNEEDIKRFIREFEGEMKNTYTRGEFLRVIDELRAIIGADRRRCPIHYPAPPSRRPGERGYEWFNAAEKDGICLPLPTDPTPLRRDLPSLHKAGSQRTRGQQRKDRRYASQRRGRGKRKQNDLE